MIAVRTWIGDVGDLLGAYFRRINIQHRLVYQVFEEDKIIKVLRMWSYYE